MKNAENQSWGAESFTRSTLCLPVLERLSAGKAAYHPQSPGGLKNIEEIKAN